MVPKEWISRWPYIRFELGAGGWWQAWLSRSSSLSFQTLTAQVVEILDEENARQAVKAVWEARYPNLYFWVGTTVPTAAWVKRHGRDGEAIRNFSLERLDYLNEQAGLALQEGWFFCTGCSQAYPREQYAYFHFAGNYCEKCKAENPAAFRQAMAETYE